MLFVDYRLGGVPLYHGNEPADWNMRVPEAVRENVVFLARVLPPGSRESLYFGGTGFFIRVPSTTVPGGGHTCLVTAKHVVGTLDLGPEWVMRINTAGGSYRDVKFRQDHKWWFHPTDHERTDVAVTVVEIPEDAIPKVLDERMVLDDQMVSRNGIGAGDDVFMVGLFTRMRGQTRNLPIVRMGNIAMIPDPGERVPGVRIGEASVVDAEAYLVEMRSVGGLSGSPVFVTRTFVEKIAMPTAAETMRGTTLRLNAEFYLLGLTNGHWEIDPRDKNDPDPRFLAPWNVEAVNVGLAVVVPSQKIKDALYHPEFVAFREAADRTYLDSRGTTTPDARLPS